MRFRHFAKFALMSTAVAAVVFAAYLFGLVAAESSENERRAIAEARVLASEIDAAWEYVDSIQSVINRNGIGEYDFKGVYCAVAAKSIAKNFSDRSEYSIRYVRENPRNSEDAPDAFELEALSSFEVGGVSEFYGMSELDGSPVFRYVSLLEIERGCLTCHGDPAGEKDVSGYLKEGMALGDVGGAVSIVMPMDAILADARGDIARAVLFFVLLMACMTVVLFWGLRRWVTDPILDENELLAREAREQSNFLTIMSHELRTPLTSILAFTELWREGGGERRPEEAELVDEVERNSQVLLTMIDNVLDTAKLEAGTAKLAKEELDIWDLVTLARSTMGPLAKKKGVLLSAYAEPGIPVLEADCEVVRRIVVNLLNNALRFTDDGGRIDLRFAYREGVLVIEVEDDGVGISQDMQERIFDRFESAGGPGGRAPGTGLGLSVVKRFAAMMGGSVAVRSALGEGSTFTVLLPLARYLEE